MNHSEQINELATALAKAQGAIKGAIKESYNSHFNAKYADLGSVWDACREALSANNLSVVQGTKATDSHVQVETMLMHTSGQWMSETITIPVLRPGAQGVGSALMYGRRYGLAAMVGVASKDEDDDGEGADGKQRVEDTKTDKKTEPAKERTDLIQAIADQVNKLFAEEKFDDAYDAYADARRTLAGKAEVEALRKLIGPKNCKTLSTMHQERVPA